MILLVDNNDSFTHNVAQLIQQVSPKKILILPHNQIQLQQAQQASHIIFSPGPGLPCQAPIMSQILNQYDHSTPILGICLGHQAICQHYGATLRNLTQPAHGMGSDITCDPQSTLLRGIESMHVGRYHSWVVDTLPKTLRPTALDPRGLIMAVEHTSKPVYGIQFHPESYITQGGAQILHRFLHETA